MPSRRVAVGAAALAVAIGSSGAAFATTPASAPLAPAGQSRIVTSGMARFEILSTTLIRTEYSPTGVFEDLPTETAEGRQAMLSTPAPAGTTVTDNGVTLTIATGKLTMTYVEKTPFTTGLTFALAGSTTPVVPTWSACQQNPAPCTPPIGGLPNPPASTDIGGYQRELVSLNPVTEVDGEVKPPVQPVSSTGQDQFEPLTAGMLNTKGYYLLDDTSTALAETDSRGLPEAVARPGNTGYMDGYFFGYGNDPAQGLKDLSDMTGPAPILPEWAFGPWFSDYQSYSASDYENSIFPQLAATGTPIDGFVLDTNWKDPADNWNSFQFDDVAHPNTLIPDPASFLAWARSYGLHTVLNTHPSIDQASTQFTSTEAAAGSSPLSAPFGGCEFYRTDLPAVCDVFDWSIPGQADAYSSCRSNSSTHQASAPSGTTGAATPATPTPSRA